MFFLFTSQKILTSATTQTKNFATRKLFALTFMAATYVLAQLVIMVMARKMELGAYLENIHMC